VTVISNTTPFIALCSVDLLHLLPSIFGSIMVASSVQEECSEGGERDTLLLAAQQADPLVLMDEKLGRNLAEYLRFRVVGTLGVLAKARTMGLIPSFSHTALNMRQQGIFFSEALIQRIAASLGEGNLH
jgi:predicted nucleic acid-binding protein